MAATASPGSRDFHRESPIATFNGFVALAVGLALAACAAYLIYGGAIASIAQRSTDVWPLVEGALLLAAAGLVLAGLYTLQPNEAAILQLFGAYRGTTRVPGLRCTNPFYTRKKISLRARNLNGERLKVNDKRGNPIEIAAVVVWRVDDTAKAFFDVDDYEHYVKLQAEAAVRHLASSFAYDEDESHEAAVREPTLLASADVVARALTRELEARFEKGDLRRRSAPHAPRVRAGDRAGDAPPAAGRSDHLCADEDRHWRRIDGRDGAAPAFRKGRRRPRRRAQGRDGQQSDDRALRRVRCPAGHQHRHAVQLGPESRDRRRSMNTLTRIGGLWIAIGTGIGTAVGVAVGAGSVGLAVGLAAGILAGFLSRR